MSDEAPAILARHRLGIILADMLHSGHTIVALLLCAGAVVAHADQNDPRLPHLFASLQHTEDAAEGAAVTEQIWRIWLETDDPTESTLMQQGVDAMAAQRLEQALARFDALVEIAPGFAEAWNKRATVYYLLGEYARSAADVRRTLELEPRHFGALSGLGLLYLALDRDAAALSAFEEALRVNPHLPGPRHNIELIKQRRLQRMI